jgi:hypothetical protein
VDFEDCRVRTAGKWQALKQSLPFGSLPIYEDQGVRIYQSHAIFRHNARANSLIFGDIVEYDIAQEALADAQEALWRFAWTKEYKQAPGAFANDPLSETLGHLQDWFVRQGIRGYWFTIH